ncbi:cation diffusion facilitator family transporter [Pelomicrobium sp. G1]|uniref:cation diffusion facilitator family transporter n=1 Tax=unclassified Pelomicrobium TaxID=2815318 RepID=UPI003F769DD1
MNAPPEAASPFVAGDLARYEAARRSTLVSIAVNVTLTVVQIVVGFFARSQALIADGLHSLSDLLSDFLVLWANRQGAKAADRDHPYGHRRIETAATLMLGIFLVGLGVALMLAAGMRLQDPGNLARVHPAALAIAFLTLVAKEGLFRYLMAVARRLRSQMLAANAWHSRSDAASSLVVLVGVAGNLLGLTFLDLLAAAVVGFMIVHMGWRLGYGALEELVDTGLAEEELAKIRATLLSTPGVRGVHELRTRRMAGQALVDAHILVDPRISVSEGHHIAERARSRVLAQHNVLDVMVHIDPEDDAVVRPSLDLPDRATLLRHLDERLEGELPKNQKTVLHYLNGKVEAEIHLDRTFCSDPDRVARLQRKIDALLRDDPFFRSIVLRRLDAL